MFTPVSVPTGLCQDLKSWHYILLSWSYTYTCSIMRGNDVTIWYSLYIGIHRLVFIIGIIILPCWLYNSRQRYSRNIMHHVHYHTYTLLLYCHTANSNVKTEEEMPMSKCGRLPLPPTHPFNIVRVIAEVHPRVFFYLSPQSLRKTHAVPIMVTSSSHRKEIEW